MELLAKDGIYLHEAPRTIDRVYLASGSRADVAVRCKCGFDAPSPCHSHMNFSAVWQPMGFLGMAPTIANSTERLLRIETLGTRAPSNAKVLSSFSVRRPCYLADLRDVWVPSWNRHHVKLPMLYPMAVEADSKGKVWGEKTPPPLKTIRVGEVQEWVVKGVKFHPFHLHVNPYQIVEIWSDPYFLPGDWHDTMLPTHIDFAKIRVNVDRFVGKMIVHCHLLEHEDNGMMGWFKISGKEGKTWPGAKKADPQCFDTHFSRVGPPPPKAPRVWR